MANASSRPRKRSPTSNPNFRETRGMANIWGRKPIAVLQAEAKEGEFGSVPGEPRLRRTLSLASLIALGIGCIIGAGIFVLTGNVPRVDHYPGCGARRLEHRRLRQ